MKLIVTEKNRPPGMVSCLKSKLCKTSKITNIRETLEAHLQDLNISSSHFLREKFLFRLFLVVHGGKREQSRGRMRERDQIKITRWFWWSPFRSFVPAIQISLLLLPVFFPAKFQNVNSI